MSYKFWTGLGVKKEVQLAALNFWLLTTHLQAWRIFGADCTRASCCGDQVLAIFCRAKSPEVTQVLRKVLLGFKAAGNGDVQDSSIGRGARNIDLARSSLWRRTN